MVKTWEQREWDRWDDQSNKINFKGLAQEENRSGRAIRAAECVLQRTLEMEKAEHVRHEKNDITGSTPTKDLVMEPSKRLQVKNQERLSHYMLL
jgi:hypothetical protein